MTEDREGFAGATLAHVAGVSARERLIRYGPDAADATLLLECLVGSREIALRLANIPGGLPALARAEPGELESLPGVGPAMAARVAAAFRLARQARKWGDEKLLIDSPHVAAKHLAWIADLPQERFFVLGLDRRNNLILEREVARGSLTGVEVHPREVLRPLMAANAAAAIVAHNHPSGDPSPSLEDRTLTTRLKQAGEFVGIPLLDHLVIGREGHYSFTEASTT